MALGRDCLMLELAMREPVQMVLLVSPCEKCHENRLEHMLVEMHTRRLFSRHTLIAHANITRSCALRYTGCMETGRLGINRHDFRIETDDGLRRTNTIVLASVYCPRKDTAAARIRSVIAANVRHPRRSLKETKVRQWRPATHQDADVLVMSSKLLEAIWLITKRWGQKCMLISMATFFGLFLHTSAVYEPRRWNSTLLLLMGQLCRISLEGNDAKMSQTSWEDPVIKKRS